MRKSTDRDRELASEIFRGDCLDWYQQAVEAIVKARSEEREKIHRLMKSTLDNPDSEST